MKVFVSGVSVTVTQKYTWLAKEMGRDKAVKSPRLASETGCGSFLVSFLQAIRRHLGAFLPRGAGQEAGEHQKPRKQ